MKCRFIELRPLKRVQRRDLVSLTGKPAQRPTLENTNFPAIKAFQNHNYFNIPKISFTSSSFQDQPQLEQVKMEDEDQPTRKEIRYHQEQPDVYVTCPYFPEHELRRSRMPYHLMKCQNNPNAPKLLACPFNYLHRVRPEDQQEHLLTCEDRVNKRFDKPSSKSAKPQYRAVRMSDNMSQVPPETGEKDWW